MGLDVLLIPKKRNLKNHIENWLSRRFCNFLCGPDAYSNCEFDQIQEIHQIDLSILRRSPNTEPDIHQLEYQLYLAEEGQDLEKIKLLEDEIEQVSIDWKKNYDTTYEGWTKIEELETVVKTLLEKLVQNPVFHKSLSYNFDWKDYFYPKRNRNKYKLKTTEEETKYSDYIDNILVEDLKEIIRWINSAKEYNIKYVGFDYG